jgi:dTDP-3,4-didehydro-2,6-dideoxy-alpha-D-glucose 3-reductase
VSPALRIGILGAAPISEKAVLDPARRTGRGVVVAVAARDLTRARDFATTHGIPLAMGDYQELLAAPDIDAVYVATANHLHRPLTIAATQAGKHVLVEKPLCLNLAEWDEIAASASQHGRLVQEALMAAHHPWQAAVRRLIDERRHGRLCSIATRFTFPLKKAPDNYRFFPQLGGGVFNDVGCYWLQFLQSCGLGQPLAVDAHSRFDGPNGIDRELSASLGFADGVRAEFFGSFDDPLCASHLLRFERAEVAVRNFLKPAIGNLRMSIEVNGAAREKLSFAEANYYAAQFTAFVDRVASSDWTLDPAVGERLRLADRILSQARAERG